MPLQIEQQKEQQCLVVILRGSFGAVEDAKQIRVAVSEALLRGQALILVNLTEVATVDDFGVEALLACGFMVSHRGGLLRIFGATGEAAAIIKSSQANTLTLEADSQQDAVSAFVESANRAGITSKPFDILKFVREEEQRGDSATDFGDAEPEPGRG